MRALPSVLAIALALVASLSLAALPGAAAYPDPDKVPTYYPSPCYDGHTKRFVHDYLEMFPKEYGVEFEGAACEVYQQTSAHYVLLTVPDTEDQTLEMYAANLFEAWGIGDAELDNGILMLYVADYLHSGEGALRIEVGYGLEPVVNSIVTEDAWDLMIESRDEALAAGDDPDSARVYAMAVGTFYLLRVIQDSYSEAGEPLYDPAPGRGASYGGSDPGYGQLWFNVILVIVVIIVLFSLAQKRGGWGYHGPSSPGWNTPSTRIWVPPSYGGDVGNMGGESWGGGGSFGGGRSGGGGRGGKF